MQEIFTKVVIDIFSGKILEQESFVYEGPIELACGPSSQQKQVFQEQNSAYQQAMQQAQQIFGNSSQIFQQLTSAFSPIVAAGPGQEGYTPAEKANLESQAITTTGQQYKNASQAAGERISAAGGGGNALLPSGTTAAVQGNIATQGAAQTANQLADIRTQSANLGRQNWLSAAGILSGAPGVFNPSTSATSAGTGAGETAGTTANQITQANQSWMNLVAPILGGIAGVATGGLFKGKSGGGNAGQSGGGTASSNDYPVLG